VDLDRGPDPALIDDVRATRGAVATLRQYGQLITAFSNDSPHVLRVDPALDFAAIVLTVETQLNPLPLNERVVGA
jgi:hypothetical protein